MRKNCGYDGYDNRTYDALKQEGYHIFVGKRFPSPTVWRYLDVLQVVARAVATAPSTEDEAWETGAERNVEIEMPMWGDRRRYESFF